MVIAMRMMTDITNDDMKKHMKTMNMLKIMSMIKNKPWKWWTLSKDVTYENDESDEHDDND